MAVPSGTFQTFQAVGNREDLSNLIFNISPMETPFTSSAKRTKVKNQFHEWQTDALDAAATNAQIEGNDAVVNTAVPTVRLKNYTQILAKTVSVSETQQAMDTAGRDDEFDYQVSKRSKELKRDLEYATVRNQPSTIGGAGTAQMLASVESWLATNKTSAGSGTAQTTAGYSSGTVAAPVDSTVTGTAVVAMLNNVIQLAYTAGGDPRTIMVGPACKVKFSTFAGIATLYSDTGNKQATIVSGADTFVSNFGRHTILPNRFQRDVTALVLDMDYWSIGELRPFQSVNLAKTGDSDKKQIKGEYTLVSRNQLASGKITDINSAL